MMKLLSMLLLLVPTWTCAFTTTTTSSTFSRLRTSSTSLGYYHFSNHREHPDDIGADRHLREDRYYWNWDDPSPDSFYREREDLAARAAGNKGAYDYDAYYGRGIGGKHNRVQREYGDYYSGGYGRGGGGGGYYYAGGRGGYNRYYSGGRGGGGGYYGGRYRDGGLYW